MAIKTFKMGPGTLILGETGTTQDFSCQLTSGLVSWSVDTEDDIDVLCGEVEEGEDDFSAALSGTLLQDLDTLTAWTWTNKGTKQPFVFIPNTAKGKQVTGLCKIRPLDVGGDVKAKPTTDFEWPCVGDPVFGDVPDEG